MVFLLLFLYCLQKQLRYLIFRSVLHFAGKMGSAVLLVSNPAGLHQDTQLIFFSNSINM